jgi:branched-chain amino acid transport system ATP-binding protein
VSGPLLEVTGLVAGFGPTTVLHGVDLHVDTDEVVCVLGLNGAGKSVTLKVIGGLVPTWKGKVVFAGEDITSLPVEQRVARGMAFVPQGRQLFPELTVAENLRLGGYLPRRKNRAASNEILDELLQRFPRLQERRDQLAGTLSGGEQAMLAVGRALMARPTLLLVDEPSAGLAPIIAAQVVDMLGQVARDGVAVFLVEQNVPLALRVSHRAHVMQRGTVVYQSDVRSLDHDRLAAELGIGQLLRPSTNGHRGRGEPVRNGKGRSRSGPRRTRPLRAR